MKEKGLSEALVKQSNLILDAVEHKIDVRDAIKDTIYHNPDESEALLVRIGILQKPKVKPIVNKSKK